MASSSVLHAVLFPFMSKGHTIPVLQLARLLLRRGITVTVFTTASNSPFVSESLSGVEANIVNLPFPQDITGVPPGVESTDKLPSISLFLQFADATRHMKPHFEQALETLPLQPVDFMVTDGFLGWTLESAVKLGIPRLVYFGMSNFSTSMTRVATRDPFLWEPKSADELTSVPGFPWVKLTRNDYDPIVTEREPKGPLNKYISEQVIAMAKSYGIVVNSFYELEPVYADFCKRDGWPKPWCVGPLCLAADPGPRMVTRLKSTPWVHEWLDQMLENKKHVLYAAFGSQTDISLQQLEEIKIGLEKSGVNFLWVVRESCSDLELDDGFEESVRGRGIVVREWVDQKEILGHESVKGFLTHCGWNSVLESICARVPMIAWPMIAEQHLNARMVVEEIKVGLRIETCDGSVRGFVKWEGLQRTVRELMLGKAAGKEVREKVKVVGEAAIKAVKDGGSSWCTLNDLINEMRATRHN